MDEASIVSKTVGALRRHFVMGMDAVCAVASHPPPFRADVTKAVLRQKKACLLSNLALYGPTS